MAQLDINLKHIIFGKYNMSMFDTNSGIPSKIDEFACEADSMINYGIDLQYEKLFRFEEALYKMHSLKSSACVYECNDLQECLL